MFRHRALPIRDGFIALCVILIVNALGALPAVFFGTGAGWIDRPWFYPPEILFPIVWTLLFTLMGLALFIVWRQGTDQRAVQVALATFAIQFALNLAWTPVFFGYPVARSKSNRQTERSGLNPDPISRVGEMMEQFLIEMAESAGRSA